MENKRSNCAKIYIPFSFLGRRLIYDIVGLFYKLFDLVAGYILIKIDTNPVFFIHMPTGCYARVSSLQLSRFIRVTFDTAKIEYFDIYEAEPFTSYIKAKNVPTVLIRNIRERHFFINTFQRKAIFPKLFNIHNIRMYDRL